MNPVLFLNVALALIEVVERGNAAATRMRELRSMAEAGTLTDEHLQEVQASLEAKVKTYRENISG